MSDGPEDLTADERARLAAMKSVMPPPELEERVIRTLEAGGLIRSRARLHSRLAPIAAAAGVLLFAAGVLLGARWSPAAAPAGPRFMLLLHSAEQAVSLDAAGEQQRADEYRKWLGSLRAEGVSIDGERLGPSGVLVDRTGTHPLAGAETRPLASLQGYFMVEGIDRDAAAALARRSPHVAYGGLVVIRAVDTPRR
jgi:hypothetical protein